MVERLRALLLGLSVAVLCAGCSGLTRMPALRVTRPPGADPQAHFASLVEATRARGYVLGPVQPQRGRFGVMLHYSDEYVDEYGPYRATVECLGGVCRIRAIGPRVEYLHRHQAIIVPREVRLELEGLYESLQGERLP